jgi:hypothetical protein
MNLYLLTHVYDNNLDLVDITQYSLRDLIEILNIAKFTKDQINQLYNNMETFDNILISNRYDRLHNIFIITALLCLIIYLIPRFSLKNL